MQKSKLCLFIHSLIHNFISIRVFFHFGHSIHAVDKERVSVKQARGFEHLNSCIRLSTIRRSCFNLEVLLRKRILTSRSPEHLICVLDKF